MANDLQFGLSLDPYSIPQRHCFYDSDEEEQDSNQEFISISGNPQRITNLLIISTTKIAGVFFKSHLMLNSLNPVSVITCRQPVKTLKGRCFYGNKERDTNDKDEEQVKLAELYETAGQSDISVCVMTDNLKEDFCNELSRKLLSHTQPKKVVVFHSCSIHEYYNTDNDDESKDGQFLVSLQTRAWSEEPLAPFLRPPNTISGEPAAILTRCQLLAIPGSLVTLYTSLSILTTKEQIKGFRPLLCHPVFSQCLPLHSLAEADKNMATSDLPKPRSDLSSLYT